MSDHPTTGLEGFSMLELFRLETRAQGETLNQGLLDLERGEGPPSPATLETLMRAAHSIKGAARIVDQDPAIRVAHALEECFQKARAGSLTLDRSSVDLLLQGVDLLITLANATAEGSPGPPAEAISHYLEELTRTAPPAAPTPAGVAAVTPPATPPPTPPPPPPPEGEESVTPSPSGDTALVPLDPELMDRLLGLAGESMSQSRWLPTLVQGLRRLHRDQQRLGVALERLGETLATAHGPGGGQELATLHLKEVAGLLQSSRDRLQEQLEESQRQEGRAAALSQRLHQAVVQVRMLPFGEGVAHFRRLVRSVAQQLGKEARLEISGSRVRVDREIMRRIDSALNHLLRNALDHGLESPDQRLAREKPAEGVIRLTAAHRAGQLVLTVEDDGAGVEMVQLRQAIAQRNLDQGGLGELLAEGELLEFLFLPNFTTRTSATHLSGRGVGLDAVREAVRGVRGRIRLHNSPGRGFRVEMWLPLSLSVVPALLVEMGGGLFAFPLARVEEVTLVDREEVATVEGRPFIVRGRRKVGLVDGHEVLELPPPRLPPRRLPVVVVGDGSGRYGVVVEAFKGEYPLVEQSLDPQLGKLPDVSAGAITREGLPALVLDVDDMVRSIQRRLAEGGLQHIGGVSSGGSARTKRILVVDDSLTVREVQRKLLLHAGYGVEVAVDGMDGWSALRAHEYHLLITDVDMPRMDGIQLVAMVKNNPATRRLPVMIVSYKDRQEDRRRGLEAGADYYLTKASFHDRALLDAVRDLIGEP